MSYSLAYFFLKDVLIKDLILFRIGEGKGSEGEEMGAALITLAP